MEPPKQTHHDHTLTVRDSIRVHAQLKHEKLKAEAIDILIDVLHRQMRGGATVSFDHNLAGKIEKLIIGDMPRAKIIAQVRTGIYYPPRTSLLVGGSNTTVTRRLPQEGQVS
jgi:hypothetical protein